MNKIITGTPFHDREIIILGAGIIGCATARTLLLKGFKVKLVAKHLPGDTDIWYASNWAGALWNGAQDIDDDTRYLQVVAYRRFRDDLKNDAKCGVASIKVKEYYEEVPDVEKVWFAAVNSNFRQLTPNEFDTKEFRYGCEFDSISIEPSRYLSYVKKEIEKLGGTFIRKEIQDIEELYNEYSESTVFVNASGVGPKYIKGIYDPDSYPNRGQNVLVKSKSKVAVTRVGGDYTYVIPRPLSEVVVCGGVNQGENFSSDIDPAVVEDELRRAHKLAPEIVSANPEIAGYVVGIRPGRKNSFRIETDKRDERYIVHAYGFNGKGYAYSYGAAYKVGVLVEEIEKGLSVRPRCHL